MHRYRTGNCLLWMAAICCLLPGNVVADETTEMQYPGKTLRDGILNLARHYESTLKKDSDSVKLYLGVADAYTMYWCFGFAPRDEVLPKIQSAAQHALALDDQDASAHKAAGIVKLSQWDWASAEEELAAAVQLDPGRASPHHWYALYLAAMGRHQEAGKHSKLALEIDSSPGMQVGRASILYFARDWEGMIHRMNRTIQGHSEFAPAYDWLGMAYVQQERFDESIATYEKAVELSEGLAEILAGLGHAYGLAGKQEQARTVLNQLQELDARWYVPPVQIAYVHVGLGEHDEAIRMLERAVEEHSWELVFLREEPWFDPLRSDPRFQEIEAKLHFPASPRTIE
jgi:tetratricopeptide (TPR) repeat protein